MDAREAAQGVPDAVIVPEVSVLRQGDAHHVASLDGIRGVAILLVIASHFTVFNATTPLESVVRRVGKAGWIGVDLFFVLSGFLITGILCDAKGQAHYFRNFYARRALRIFPVYYGFLFLLFLIVTQVSLFERSEYRELVQSQGWYWSFLFNYRVADRGHWAPDPYWTTHFWSLAVEEQFYLVWPALVAILSRRWLVVVCAIIVVGSAVLRTLLRYDDPEGVNSVYVYTSTLTQCDGLACGALIALAARSPAGMTALRRWSGPAMGVALVALGVIVYSVGSLYTADRLMQCAGFSALALLFGGALGQVVTRSSGWIARFLSARPLTSFGRYSYMAYVIHLPIAYLFFTRLRLLPDELPRVMGSAMFGQVVVLTLGLGVVWTLSALSFRFYEQPVLRLKRWFSPRSPEEARPRWVVPTLFAPLLFPLSALLLVRFARTDPGMEIADKPDGMTCDLVDAPALVMDPTKPITAVAHFSGAGTSTFEWTATGGELGATGTTPNHRTLDGFVVSDSFDGSRLDEDLWGQLGPGRVFVHGGLAHVVLDKHDGQEGETLRNTFALNGSVGVAVTVAHLDPGAGRTAVVMRFTADDGAEGHIQLLGEGATRTVESNTAYSNGAWQGSTTARVSDVPVRMQIVRFKEQVWYYFDDEGSGKFKPLGGPHHLYGPPAPAYVALQLWTSDRSDSPVAADLDDFGAGQNTAALWSAPLHGEAGATYTLSVRGQCAVNVTVAP